MYRTIKEMVTEKIYDAMISAGYDKYVIIETTEIFWKEVLREEIGLNEIDEHLKRFCNSYYEEENEEDE
jgi:hypothetical protein